MSNRHAELTTRLRTLKLQAMAERVLDLAVKAARAGLSQEALLYALVRLECEQRAQRRIARYLRESGLPREKTLRTLRLAPLPPLVRQQLERLRSGQFVQEAINVVAVGRPGVGKSHLLAGLGHALVQQGYPVVWTSTAQLMQRVLAAKRDLRLPQEWARLDRCACLILDDSGEVQHDQDEMEILFTRLSERYARNSVMLSTNLVFSEWTRIFKSPLTTMAALDRVVHHSVILDLMAVESYRAKEATSTQRYLTTTTTQDGTDGMDTDVRDDHSIISTTH